MKRAARLLFAFAVVLGLILGAASSAYATDGMRPVITEEFDTWQSPPWLTTFYQPWGAGWDPALGTRQVSSGVLSLRPSYFRGASGLYTFDKVVTRVPAHVSFRVRFPVNVWRHPSIVLQPLPYYDAAGHQVDVAAPVQIGLALGSVNHLYYPYYRDLSVSAGGVVDRVMHPAVLPADQWLDCDMWLYEDRVVATLDGDTMEVHAPLKAAVEDNGGLALAWECDDDYAQGGCDFDYIRTEQAPGSPLERLIALRAAIEAATLANPAGNVPPGYKQALLAKIDRAIAACEAGDSASAAAAIENALVDGRDDPNLPNEYESDWEAEAASIAAALRS